MEAAALGRAPRRRLAAAGQLRLLRLAGDARLAKAVGAGSDAAFEVLYERHHRALLAFCRHMLGNREEAEDALQSAFMAAYRELRSDREAPVELRPWLYTIARHRCQRTLRARAPRDFDERRSLVTEGLGDQVQRRAELRAILGDLARLPEDQRAALLLAQLHGMSHEEIGVVVDVPTRKVKALVFQARKSLAASREARAIPCAEIRAQLAELSGGALRRRALQRHLRACEGCREFRAQLRRQRTLLATALPVVPTAGLREAVLGATTGGAASAGGAGGLLATAGALKSVAAKLAVGAGATAVLAGGMAAGGSLLRSHRHASPPPATVPRAHDVDPAGAPTAAAAPAVATGAVREHGVATTTGPTRHHRRHRAGRAPRTTASRTSAPAGARGGSRKTSDAAATAPGASRGKAGGRGTGHTNGHRNPTGRGNTSATKTASGSAGHSNAGSANAGKANAGGNGAATGNGHAQGATASGQGAAGQARGAVGAPSVAPSPEPPAQGTSDASRGQAKKAE
jgi:RNA polymerase sigma factor (sigma-70 family)